MYCTKCGSELNEGSQFCSACGAQTLAGQTPAMNQAAPMQEQNQGTGLVLGILGLIFMFFLSIVGLILCILAVVKGSRMYKILPEDSRGQALAGMILGIIGLVIFIVSVVTAGFRMAAFY